MSTIRVYNRSLNHDPLTKKAIVLDIDSTLLNTQTSLSELHKTGILTDPGQIKIRKDIYYLTLDQEYGMQNSSVYKMWGVKRPYLDDFLRFCFEYFRYVFVWSAGTPPYVNSVVQTLFLPLGLKPHGILNRNDCIILSDGTTYKPLQSLYNRENINPVNPSFEINATNTMALDDNSSTFIYNAGNGIHIPAYDVYPNVININRMLKDDNALLKFMYWLSSDTVINANDVRNLKKDAIFSTSIDTYSKIYHQVSSIDLNKIKNS